MSLLVPLGLALAVVVGLVLAPTILNLAADPNANIVCFLGASALNDLVPFLYYAVIVLFAFSAIATGVVTVKQGSISSRAFMIIFAVGLSSVVGIMGGFEENRAFAQTAGSCLLRNGSLAMTGNLDMDSNNILNVGTLSGHTLAGNVAAGANDITGVGNLGATNSTTTTLTATTTTITGTLTASGGGSLTGTWTDLGTVSTVNIDGGTVDGATIGGSSAAAGTFTSVAADNTTIDADAITTSAANDLTLNSGGDIVLSPSGTAQDYALTDRASRLALQGKSAANETSLEIYSNDGDGTDDVGVSIFGVGTPASVVNSQRIILQWNAANTEFRIRSSSSGGSAPQDLRVMVPTGKDIFLADDSNAILTANSTTTSVGIGAVTFPSTGDTALIIASSTVIVSGMNSATAGLYAAEVSGTTELFAIDGAGNSSQLSNHPSNVMAQSSLLCLMPPGAVNSSNYYIGKSVSVDWCAVLLALEALTGQTFMTFQDLPASQIRDWDDDQEAMYQIAEKRRRQASARRTQLWNKWLDLLAIDTSGWPQDAITSLVNERKTVLAEYSAIEVPPRHRRVPPPQWMRDRGVSSNLP